MADDLEVQPYDRHPNARALGSASYPAYAGHSLRQSGFDGSRFTQFVRQNYKPFLLVFIATLAAAVIITILLPKKYTTYASILLDQRHQQVVQGMDDVVSSLPGQDPSVVDTEVQLLSSPGMAYQVGRAMGMVPDVEPSQLTGDQRDQVANTVLDILKHRDVERVGLTYIMQVYYTSPDPGNAQAMANAFAQSYIGSQVGVRVQANERVKSYLTREISRLEKQVTDADAEVALYKAKHNLSDTTVGGTLTDQEISSYNQTLAAASAQEAEDAQRLAAARAQLARGGVNALGDSQFSGLAALRNQETQLSAKVADLASRYGPNHPDLVNARDQLKDTQRLIAAQSDRAVASLQAQAQASAGRASAIGAKLAQTESALQRSGKDAVTLHDLQMKLDAPKKLLEAYQDRLSQISTQAGDEQPDARVISFAPYPLLPSSPKLIINLILGIGAGLVFATMAVLLRHILLAGVRTPEDVEALIGVDFLAALPLLKERDDIAIINKVVEAPYSPYAEAVRSLAASVQLATSESPQIIGITSAYEGESKTTTAIALARVVAMRERRRVLVIDGDTQRPSFYQRLGLGSEFGLVEVLRKQVTLEQAVTSDVNSHADILQLGQGLEPGRTIDEQALAQLFTELRGRYDLVVIDLPPVLQVAETRVIAALTDSVIMLARWRRTSRQAVEMAIAVLARSRVSVAGIALTQVPASSEILMPAYRPPSPLITSA